MKSRFTELYLHFAFKNKTLNKLQSHKIYGHEQMSKIVARAVSTKKEKEEKIETLTDDRNV